MKVTNVEKMEKSVVELTIHVEADAFEAAVQAAYLKERKNINVPGFRKGKATRKIIENLYGTGVFYEAAIDAVYPEALEAAVAEQGLEMVGYPTLNIVEVGAEQGLIFKAGVPVKPEVKLGQYKGLSAEKADVTVTDEDIDAEMKPMIDRATRIVSVERAAQNGDIANINFEGFKDGVPFEGGKGEDYNLELGAGTFVPGFEEQVVGMNIGEEKDLDITFPEDYVADLAGAAVVFKVKLNGVKEKQIPALDDEFAKDVSEFETMAALREDLAKKVQERKEANAKRDFEMKINKALVANMECEIPDGMIDQRTDNLTNDMYARVSNEAKQFGMTAEQYFQMMGMTPEMIKVQNKMVAEQQIQLELALEAVAVAEGIEIADEEVNAEYDRLAEQYKMEVEVIKNFVAAEDIAKDMRLTKAQTVVIESAVVAE